MLACAYACIVNVRPVLRAPLGLQGTSDLQLERMNVYFNEASGGAVFL